MASSSNRHRKKNRLPDYHWVDYDDEQLLAMKFKNLKLQLRNSPVWPAVERLHAELERRGIPVRPHCWLSTEWFCPDGIPGIAIPFYLAHPRLAQLERKMMGDVEGGSMKWRMRILRHEAGHAIDNAYALRRRSDWRKIFGRASEPYRNMYTPRPGSHRYVLHIGHWYAQSHPTEDFAETFAVWMQPKARWRRDYEDWPALRKLEYVDELMAEISETEPVRRSRSVIEPLSELDMTLGQHYRKRMNMYGAVEKRYDKWITRVFTARNKRPRGVPASRYVREIDPQLRRLLERRARLHPYFIDHAIRTVRQRARDLDLVLRQSTREAKRKVVRLHERIVLDILQRNRENYTL
jgi:hypothetical protein